MSENSPALSEQDFINLFNQIARHKHRFDVFRDFVTLSAISLHNAIYKNEQLESEYLSIINGYTREDIDRFPQLLGILIKLLDPEPKDVLGGLYMDLGLGSYQGGQFFSPPSISDFMARMTYGKDLTEIDDFITFSEPNCGAGGMVLAFAKELIAHGHNPAETLWVQCWDIDRLAAFMCFVQLSLWNIPAQIVVGDTLAFEAREIYYTPAHYLSLWDSKLTGRQAKVQQERVELAITKPVAKKSDKPAPVVKPLEDKPKGQLDFGF